MEDLARTCKTLKRSPVHRLLHLHFHRPISPSLHSGTLNNPSRSSCDRLSCSALPSVLFVKRYRNKDEPYLYRIWRRFVKCRIRPIWISIPICQRRAEARPIDSMSGDMAAAQLGQSRECPGLVGRSSGPPGSGRLFRRRLPLGPRYAAPTRISGVPASCVGIEGPKPGTRLLPAWSFIRFRNLPRQGTPVRRARFR